MGKLEDEIITFAISDFLADRRLRGCSPKTIQFYDLELKYFEIWTYKEVEEVMPVMEKITADVIRKYLVELGKHRNFGGVHCAYRSIRAFYNFLWNELDIDTPNPMKKIKIKNNHLDPLPEIPLSDVEKLINVIKGRNSIRDEAVIKILIDTACRGSELTALNFGDVNLDNSAVTIQHGKGDKKRVVYIGKNSLKSLNAYLATRENLQADSPLFLNEDGNRLAFFGLRMLIHRLCRRAGIKEFGLHAFRRSCALHLYNSGVDIYTISRYLGHSGIEVTKRYLNVTPEDTRNAMKSFAPMDSLNV